MAKTFSTQGGLLKYEDTTQSFIKGYNLIDLVVKINGDNLVFPDGSEYAYNDVDLTNSFASVEEFFNQIGTWKITSTGTAGASSEILKGSFGEQITSHKTPVVQLDNKHQLDPANHQDVEIFEATGGSADNNKNLFRCQSGTSLGGYGVIRSLSTLNYHAGQGIEAQYTASFTTGVPLSLQFGGMFNLTNTLAFGYDGANFGIIHEYAGEAEVQLITVTATGAGTTTVTLGGDAVGITTTAGTVQTVAEEIRAGLEADGTVSAKWRFEQVNDRCYAISKSVGDKTGTFSVTGASTCTIVEKTAGLTKSSSNVVQANWNVSSSPFDGFDPTKINIYKIQFGYLGVANINFSIYNPSTGEWVLVHRQKWANDYNTTHISDPNFKIGWTAASLGATGTNLTVEGASASLMLEGDELLENDTHAHEAVKTSIGTTLTNLLTIKPRVIFNDRYNLGKIKPLRLSVDNDHTKGIIVELYKSATVSGTLNYQYDGEFTTVAVVDEAGTTVSGGTFVDGFTVGSNLSEDVDLKEIVPRLLPGETLTVAVKTTSGTASNTTGIFTWKDDK